MQILRERRKEAEAVADPRQTLLRAGLGLELHRNGAASH